LNSFSPSPNWLGAAIPRLPRIGPARPSWPREIGEHIGIATVTVTVTIATVTVTIVAIARAETP
jgi:hypothetical protein